MPDDRQDDQVSALEALVGDLHRQAQALNKKGQEAEATALYQRLATLDDRALDLRLAQAALPAGAAAFAAHAAAGWAAYCAPPLPLAPWARAAAASGVAGLRGEQVRRRALAAILGAALGDSAACPVQWVYAEPSLAALAQGREGLEFLDPPQCPFFDYPPGAASPLADAGGLDCCHYAAHLFATFGPGFRGYRVTQNNEVAVAYGCAAALVLEAVLLGASVTAAVASTTAWLQQREAAGLSGGFVPAARWGEVAARLAQAAALAPLPPLEAATRLGRNCHLPNSLQTPLQVLLHVEHLQQRQQRRGEATASWAEGLAGSALGPGPAEQQGGTDQRAAAESEFCLPCSMGGGACPLPPRSAQRTAGDGGSALAGAWSGQEVATLPPDAFMLAIRLALRPGGCCASRAGFAGALAAALLQGGAEQLPADWAARASGYGGVQQLAQRLQRLRD